MQRDMHSLVTVSNCVAVMKNKGLVSVVVEVDLHMVF